MNLNLPLLLAHAQQEYMLGYGLAGAMIFLGMLVVCVGKLRKKAYASPAEEEREKKRLEREKANRLAKKASRKAKKKKSKK